MTKKYTIYQVLPRLFGNRVSTCKEWGAIAENGCGKFSSFTHDVLLEIKNMGFTHIWFTGVIRHATQTDYSKYGIPCQNKEVVKGNAGSPYAITDYYDVDPDLSDDCSKRMEEWESLIGRTHETGMKVIMDFVPNHVAREYHSICKPEGVADIGENDDVNMNFSAANNFYYCNQDLDLDGIVGDGCVASYKESPARATGNDKFDNRPSCNDWYETVKLNYGIDYCDAGGRSYHFDPIPDTWLKMTDILLFWASKGIDGFRCDMAEMVPAAFWSYATSKVKEKYPTIVFIGEVYDTNQYRTYIASGFDYLYDKVGMYDCLRAVIRGEKPASCLTGEWQATDDIHDNMLYFLENHDEQRIASDFFARNARKALPAVMFSALFGSNPFMLYSGQEYGEKGMDKEGFSGVDGRTTIFDYWAPSTLKRAADCRLTEDEKLLAMQYNKILNIALKEKAVSEGNSFDLMCVNISSDDFDPRYQFAFMRKKDEDLLLVVLNFQDMDVDVKVKIPSHAFDFLNLPERTVEAIDLIEGDTDIMQLKRDGNVSMHVARNYGRVYKIKLDMANREVLLNEHNKEEFPPAHTAEHLLNQLMIRMYGCERSRNAHIERKKSKISYILDHKPSHKEEVAIEKEMNRLIEEDLPVTFEFVTRDEIPEGVSLDKLPADASETLRLVRIGDYDVCPCVGKHVRSTSQIGRFELLGTNWDEQQRAFRIRFKVIP